MSEDIHDLFGRDGADDEETESEAGAADSVDVAEESDEPGGGSDGSSASAGFPSLGDGDEEVGAPASPSGSDATGSTATSGGLDLEDADGSGMDWSASGSQEGSTDDDGGFEPAVSPSGGSASEADDGSADDAFELSESPGPSRGEAEEEATDTESGRDVASGSPGGAGDQESTSERSTDTADDEGQTGSAGGAVVPDGEEPEGSRPDRATTASGGIGDDDAGQDDPTAAEGSPSTTATEDPAGEGADDFDAAESSTDAGVADDDVPATGSKRNAPDGQDDGIEVEPDEAGPNDRSTASAGGLASGDTDVSSSAMAGPSGDAAETSLEGSNPDSATASADGTSAADPGAPVSGTGGEPSSSGGIDERRDAESRSATTTTDSPSVDGESGQVQGSTEASRSASSDSDDQERPTLPTSGSNRLSTGIEALDEVMGGGVPPGRMIVLVADPGVQSDLIVDSVLAQRDTLYVTTDRPDWEVQKDIEPGLGSGEVEIRDHTPDSLLLGVDALLDEIGTSSNFVLDSVNELELVPRQRYRIFLSDVKRRLFDTGSVGLLTGVTVDHESARDLTLRRADIVWRLETRTTGKEIVNLLSVPKFRGGAAVTETVKLELTDEVRVDPSWNDE